MVQEIEITLDETGIPIKYLGLIKEEIPALVTKYVTAMETQETNDWCRCEWVVHPDDVGISDHHCRICGAHNRAPIHSENAPLNQVAHDFRGKRMRKVDEAPDCPVHTKEGFLMYFFEWVFTHDGD